MGTKQEWGFWVRILVPMQLSTDYLPVYLILPHEVIKHHERSIYIEKRFYAEDQINNFKDKIKSTDWSTVYGEKGTDNKYNAFIQIIVRLHDEHFPLVRIRVNSKTQAEPWISHGILNCIKKKNSMYKHCLFDKSQECKDRYKRYKNRLTCILGHAEKEYYASKLLEMKDNAAKTWKILNEMTNRKSKNKSVTSLKINNVLISHLYIDNPQLLANSFNNFFSNIGPQLAKQICPKPS